jgi:hypothetical protein
VPQAGNCSQGVGIAHARDCARHHEKQSGHHKCNRHPEPVCSFLGLLNDYVNRGESSGEFPADCPLVAMSAQCSSILAQACLRNGTPNTELAHSYPYYRAPP